MLLHRVSEGLYKWEGRCSTHTGSLEEVMCSMRGEYIEWTEIEYALEAIEVEKKSVAHFGINGLFIY